MSASWRARALINTSAFAHNLARVRALAPNSEIIAVIKANAYGHGIAPLAKALTAADRLAVIDVTEAKILRQQGLQANILILQGCNHAEELAWCVENQAAPVVVNAAQLELLSPYLKQLPQLWLKLDSGMHRLGLTPQAVKAAATSLSAGGFNGQLGLFTHFACADEDAAFTQQQIDCFDQLAAAVAFDSHSLANSAAIFDFPASHQGAVRPGIMLYGSSPFIAAADAKVAARSAESLGLKPVMTLQARVAALHQLSAGEAVGYGLSWRADQATQVAVISAGYGDGVPRNLPMGTVMAVGERLGRLVARVSMDSCYVAFAPDEPIAVGDIATLWGETAGGQLLSVDDAAVASNTIGYELLCRVTPRVPRIAVTAVTDRNH